MDLARHPGVTFLPMKDNERRINERIPIQMPTRMWLNEKLGSRDVEFEGFATTDNLAIGGVFLHSTYLLPVGFPVNLEMEIEEGESLDVRGEVVHGTTADESDLPGMGVLFTKLDAENRERLLRFFVSERIQTFYEERFSKQFPHLQGRFSLQDVALLINLWEDKESQFDAELHGGGTGSNTKRRLKR